MKLKLLASLSIVIATTAFAQQLPVDPSTNVPPQAFILNALVNIWPNVNTQLTNTYNKGEIVFSAAPLWKTATSSGSTPYLSIEGDYYVTKHFGIGGEVITLGNGEGNNDIDTGLVNFYLRKDVGNLAGYLIASGGYNFNTYEPVGAFGLGVVYSYPNHIRWFVDSRMSFSGFTGDVKKDQGWLSRVGVQFIF